MPISGETRAALDLLKDVQVGSLNKLAWGLKKIKGLLEIKFKLDLGWNVPVLSATKD